MVLSARVSDFNRYNQHPFDPKSALSALPSLQIKTIVPVEAKGDGIKRYK